MRLLTVDWNAVPFDTLAANCLIIQKVWLHQQPVEISREQVFPVLQDGKLRLYPVSVFLVGGTWDRFMISLANSLWSFLTEVPAWWDLLLWY